MRKLIIFLLCSTLFTEAKAADVVKSHFPEASVVGSARLTYLFWDVYDATLYAPEGKWSSNQPFALRLDYLRSLDGEEIAKRSTKEIRQQGFNNEVKLAGWYSQMRTLFPDVNNGSTLTGMYRPNQPTRFYSGDTEIGVIHDPEFGKWFFGIWLSENTSEPAMRKKILGIQ
jgi:hypothetical protein